MKSSMFFSNNNNKTITTNTFPNQLSMLTLSQKTMTYSNPPLANQSNNIAQSSQPKKLLWGEPIWFFFHTMAHKVKDEYFDRIKNGLLQMIYSICSYLPCPTCAEHAKEYLNGINFMTIQTKSDLKNMLFNFHNSVNERKNISLFSYSDIDPKYDKAITVNIINNFMIVFSERSKNTKMMANDFHKNRVVSQLRDWLTINTIYFDK